MARFTRNEIEHLCKRLELHSTSVCGTPTFKGDLKAAAVLLRLFMVIHEIDSVETTLGATTTNDGQRMS